ncbi:MAG TPA: hypothetical protein PLY25_07230 [Bacteroidia bacterium]|nr:hypothetical protein [Bacteroidia bacterium]
MTTVTQSQIELNEQILFSKDAGLFVGRIVEIREKAIKVDYCFESVWSNGAITVFNYTTWIPKSVVINDEIGGLTVKKWFANTGLNAEKVFHIKKYFMKGEEKIFV